jgi:acyl-CoA carboxylase epsilon subunit
MGGAPLADTGMLPLLRVVRGKASAEETAALVAALALARAAARRAALADEGHAQADGAGPYGWRSRARLSPVPLRHGPGAWRASGLPH